MNTSFAQIAVSCLTAGLCFLGCAGLTEGRAGEHRPRIPVVPRPRKAETIVEWRGTRIADLWHAANDSRLERRDEHVVVHSTGSDPYLIAPCEAPSGHYELVVEYRAGPSVEGVFSVFWATSQPFSERRRKWTRMVPDSKWHQARIEFETDSTNLSRLRVDPGSSAGEVEIRRIQLRRVTIHPLDIGQVSVSNGRANFTVVNDSDRPVTFQVGGKQYSIAAQGDVVVSLPVTGQRAVDAVELVIKLKGWPDLRRNIVAYADNSHEPWRQGSAPFGILQVARDGSAARIRRGDRTVVALAPLVLNDGQVLRGELKNADSDSWEFEAQGIRWRVAAEGVTLRVTITSGGVVEGPVVRAFGELRQGLFAGVEYLGRGESSSSKLDIETDEHIRFAPEIRDVTLPLMAFVTDRGSVAMTWEAMVLQPVYATPNFIDAADDHRMALRGRRIDATVRMADDPLEEAILWCVRRRGLPAVPQAPRSPSAQRKLDLAGLHSVQEGEAQWRHARGDRWQPRPFADMASTVWRLTGELPGGVAWQPGGAHLPNHAAFFVSGQGDRWEQWLRARAQQLIQQQRPDGSFRYHGKYARGHFEDTASGYCAVRATHLLEAARLLDDRTALEAGLKSLEFMKRFRTPRGAQTWECPLHTPDLLASAYLVWAYVRGYELTGDESYLREARRWALSGLPFVYQWSDRPIMLYATTPVLGATNWLAPNWIGRPVQWVGVVYAYALTLLSPYESTLEWGHVAQGILRTAWQMQYSDGPSVGLLPDAFELDSQARLPADINPCSLVSLQRRLKGQVDSLFVLRAPSLHAVGPFPMKWDGKTLVIEGQPGQRYWLRINGHWREQQSRGTDRVPVLQGK